MKGKNITIEINNLEALKGMTLEGSIIRISNNDGEYVIGCSMPRDNRTVGEYVSKNYSE